MTHPIRTLFTAPLTLVVLALFVLSPVGAEAKSSPPPRQVEWFQYVVKFTCGVSLDVPTRVVKGEFATAVSLYNYNGADVTLRKNLALAYPPVEQESGEVSNQIEDILSPGSALQVDCEEIRNEFVFPTPPPATDLVQGFLVIESRSPLHVEAVHTAAGATAGDVSIDVERIAERKVSRPLVLATLVPVCHFPPGNPSNPITIFVGASALPAHLAHGDARGVCVVVD